MDWTHDRAVARHLVTLLWTFCLMLLAFSQPVRAQDNPWRQLAAGLELGRFKVAEESVAGDSTITILRIDPVKWELKLLSVTETGEPAGLSAKEWCQKYHLVAAINAGMYQKDHRSHIGYMKSRRHVNCARRNNYQSAAAFDPLRPGLPPFRIFDLDRERLDSVISRYGSVIQNIRMINRARENRWSVQPNKWSEVALGEDDQGRALFIFCRSPYTVHKLNDILRSLPIGLVCSQHLDGGNVAELYVNWQDQEIEGLGSYETRLNENNLNQIAWPLPNIIGIAKRE